RKSSTGGPAREALVLLLDCSGSMRVADGGGNISRLMAAQRAASDLVTASTSSRVGVVSFADVATILCRPGDRAEATRKIMEIKAGMGTFMAAGIHEAVQALEPPEPGIQVRRIILMTDGFPAEPDREVIAEAQTAKNKGILIDCVAFGTAANERLLAEIARLTEGVSILAKDAASLARAFLSLEANTRGLLGSGKTP
ncbi:MAG: vWA domain-containing protein, partial [Nitrospirota bacterium]